MAIIDSLKRVKQICRPMDRVKLFTDSQSVVASLTSLDTQHSLIEYIRELILDVMNIGIDLTISWIRAHNDTTGNEYADYLAKAGVSSKSRVCYSAVPRSYIKTTLKDQLKLKTSEYMNKNTSASILSIPSGWNSEKYANDLSSCTVQVLSGHGPFPAYLHRFKLADSPSCLCGDSLADTRHFIDHCPITKPARDYLFTKIPPSNRHPSELLGKHLSNNSNVIDSFCMKVIDIIRANRINLAHP